MRGLILDKRTTLFAALILQALALPFTSHGYDLIVGYVAGKNVAEGISPYEGGIFHNLSYPSQVQGIGETPLWPLFLGMVYAASGGDIFVFNIFMKVPVLLANVFLSLLLLKRGLEGPFFYLTNPLIVVITVLWGKPDSLATLVALLALFSRRRPIISAVLFSISLNIKPLAVGLVPLAASSMGLRRGVPYLFLTCLLSLAIFSTPFLLLGWSLSTPLAGAANWLRQAGGVSPLNILEYWYGWSYGGYGVDTTLLGIVWLLVFSAASIRLLIKAPIHEDRLWHIALAYSSLFILGRPHVSEQNLILPLVLLHFATGRPARRTLWLTLLAYSILNFSVPQLLYPLWPSVTVDIYNTTWPFDGYRLLARTSVSIIFYLSFIREIYRAMRLEANSTRPIGY